MTGALKFFLGTKPNHVVTRPTDLRTQGRDAPATLGATGVHKRAHFAHRSHHLCASETALHLYATELLEHRKTLTLSALALQEAGFAWQNVRVK